MVFEEFKKTILEMNPVSSELEYELAIFWLHREHLPVGIVGTNFSDAVIHIPQWYKNAYGRKVPVIVVASDVLGKNQNLTDLILPPSIERFPQNMFRNCRKLKRFTFPRRVKHVRQNTFCDCIALEDVYYEGTQEEWKRVEIVRERREADKSKLGLYCTVKNFPIPGNESLLNAKIHFNCVWDEESGFDKNENISLIENI